MRAVVPPLETWPAPGVARPLDGAVVAVVPEVAVVGGDVAGVVGVAVVGVWKAVVGVADVAGVEPPPMGGWVSGTVVAGVVAVFGFVVVVLMSVGVWVVVGAAVVVFVVSSPLRTTNVAMPAPRTPKISTASAMPTSRLRWVPPELSRAGFRPSALCRVGQRQTRTPGPGRRGGWPGSYDGPLHLRV